MRLPSPYLARGEELDVTMTPLIDVVFLLLVFFLWTTSFQMVEQMLPSRLAAVAGAAPSAGDPPPPEADFDRVVIRVRGNDGQVSWQVNDTMVDSLTEVQRRLSGIAAIKRDAPVILHPDPTVPIRHVIDLYDVARLVGFERIQFAASQPI